MFEQTAGRLWRRLSRDERQAAARHFFEQPPQEALGSALAVLIKARHLRPQVARSMPPEEQARQEFLAVVEGLECGNGTIEAEIAGQPALSVGEGARGFVGIAFRVQPDLRTYDCFYLRPTNGRAEDQERRNHAAQYISHPDFPWHRLRKETPSRYEAYVDLQPGVWTKLKIEVRGDKARLFVHDQPQPALIVNDVKSGATGKGGVALWIDAGTVAHFRNLTVAP